MTHPGSSSVAHSLETLLLCSEKAATLARLIRTHSLFDTLIQRKCAHEANARFDIDLKTLADVLIQEGIRYDLEKMFPNLGSSVHGEENNSFQNSFGEVISLSITDPVNQLTNTLEDILTGDRALARSLSQVVLRPLDSFRTHTAVQSAISGTRTTSLNDVRLDLSLCELWVDPIDATAEYAEGVPVRSSDSFMITDFIDQQHSLAPCILRYIPGTLANVTVLIGVFDRISGIPFLGVVNQPFYLPSDSECSDTDTSFHSGRLFWGFRSPDFTSPTTSPCQIPVSSTSVYRQVSFDCPLEDVRTDALLRVACSYPEVHRLERIFQSWSPNSRMSPTVVLLSSPGAGFKLMCLCRAEIDIYLLLLPSAYFWDTCAPHAILRSLSPDGGGLIRLSIAVAAVRQMLTDSHPESSELISSISSRLTEFQVVYTPKQPNRDLAEYRHSDGLLAYRNGQLASRLLIFLAIALPSA
ncbi:hypothetical protein EG68_07455 [Paragonimus skrjabini miyazakii]|uniref:Inositol polyphosphate 1-phosphatase n=1 Tax=Paragonimus skrjabini miyazakii TaxID=59628 RepID=A0A8S9YU47_9TREM|nr:hypothetical protein EG68_07455 [Paragonimus skrjabini miyazakii]